MASTKSDATGTKDAIAALIADHRKVKVLFKQFEELKDEDGGKDKKESLVLQICAELTIHATLEEEIFYPAVRAKAKIEDEGLMDEALVEHAGAKELVAQLQEMSPDAALYDAKVTVLGEQIDHHVKEEEGEMFPQARKAEVDTAELAAQMAQRRTELKARFGGAVEDADEAAPPRSSERNTEKRPRSS